MPLVLHSPSTLLMWPASLARIHTNNDHGNTQLIYKQSVVDSGFPEMIHFIGKEKCNGKIQAGTVPGRTTVYVFNQQQDQSLSINIEIKEISQLLIQGDTNLYVDEEQELGKKKKEKIKPGSKTFFFFQMLISNFFFLLSFLLLFFFFFQNRCCCCG